MRLDVIINSLLDTDLYKFTMMQVILHNFPAAEVEYRFTLRKARVDIKPYAQAIQAEIEHLCNLVLQTEEINYLCKLPYMKEDYILFLSQFKLNKDFIHVHSKDEFGITIRGPWLHTILFEVPVLAIISEVYFRHVYPDPDLAMGRKKLQDKIDFIRQQRNIAAFAFSDFGTRRRFSHSWQQEVITTLQTQVAQHFMGTSNVFFAKKYDLAPVGTMAHEYIQAFQALGPNVRDSQHAAFDVWIQEYRGKLAIALSDTLGLNTFIRDFDLYFAKAYDGIRHDSGDPIAWGKRILEHYWHLGVDPTEKILVFSDALTMPKAIAIYRHFHQQCRTNFGIGTNLTNDLGYKPLDMVIKMTACNGLPVAKISDDPGKEVCTDAKYLAFLKRSLT